MTAARAGFAAVLIGAGLPLLAGVPAHAAEARCGEREYYSDNADDMLNGYRLGASRPGGANRLAALATGKGVTVAVIDSGVEMRNKHLRDAVLPGKSFAQGDPSARDDPGGHGTVVAGIIAARPVEGSVLIGLAPEAKILPVRVYAAVGQEGFSGDAALKAAAQMADGIRYAADKADVINVSITASDVPAVEDAIAYAVKKGAVVVAAAGNRSEGQPDGPLYPAAYPGVIGVSATNLSGTVTEASVHGPHVDVTAPGQSVLTTFGALGDCVIARDAAQSSYATAYVSALAALLRERFPTASAEEIARRITGGASQASSGARDDREGWGQIQPWQSLTMEVGADNAGSTARQAADAGPVPAWERSDPMAPSRSGLGWWAVAGGGVLALALVTGPLLSRRRRAS